MLRAQPVTADPKGIVVAKPEWGTKHICNSCGVRFYDLMRSPIVCSACGAVVEPKTILRPRNPAAARAAAAAAAASVAALAAAEVAVGPDAVDALAVSAIDGGDDDESGLIEDTSDLIADDDDPATYAGADLDPEF